MQLAMFCDDGAFRERAKPRRVIRNVYETYGVHKIGRYHTYQEN